MYTQRSKYWPAYTWKIQTSYSKGIKDNLSKTLKISEKEFGRRYFDIFHKINASFYHLKRLEQEQTIAVKVGEAVAKIKIPGMEKYSMRLTGSPHEPIDYEYEAFLVTIKSALDFIAELIMKSFGQKGNSLGKLMKWIEKKERKNKNSLEKKIYSLLEDSGHRKLIEIHWETKRGKWTRRDFTVHRGKLKTGTTNISSSTQGKSVLLTKALDPNESAESKPLWEAEDIVSFCEDQFYQTCDLLIDVLSFFIEKELKPDSKGSVYEQKQKPKAKVKLVRSRK